MKILIHGRKNGYTVLYPKPTPPEFYSFASDIQSINAINNNIYYGKNFYTLAFTGNGCIFTKYVFGDDVERGQLGEIGISIFIPNNQKLSGNAVKTLLDELVSIYSRNYIVNNQIVQPTTGFDWLLFTSLINNYEAQLRPVPADDVENYQQGTNEASFVLYASETELQRYFDAPYQEEYSDFKQIFFLEYNANELLKLIKHDASANLTGKIDLDDPKYKLLFHAQETGGLQIEVKANGKRQSNKNKVRRKSTLEITYSQKYRESETITGTWNDIKNKRPQSIIVDDINGTVSIKPIILKEQRRVVAVNTLDETTNNPIAANITCTNRYKNLSPVINQVTFIGNDIGEQWIIRVEASGYKIEEHSFVPESEIIITVKLAKQKIIEIRIVDKNTNQPISNPKISVYEGRCDRRPQYHLKNQPNRIVFVGREIEKEWYLEVEATNYCDKSMGKFYPNKYKEGDVITVSMKRRSQVIGNHNRQQPQQKNVTISFEAGKGGKLRDYDSNSNISIEFTDHESIVKKYAPNKKANFLFKFVGWSPEENGSKIKYIAKFKPDIKLIQRLSIVAVLAVLIISLCWFFFGNNKQKQQPQQPPSVQYIEQYTQGDALLPDSLNVYKAQLEKESKKETKEIISKFVWRNPLTWFDKSEEKVTVQTDSVALNVLQKVEAALALRTAIKNGDCDGIKQYLEQQNKFRDVLQKEKFCDMLTKIDDRDKLPIAIIAEKIDSLSQRHETSPPKQEEEQHKVEENVEQPIRPPKPNQTKKNDEGVASDKTSEIIQYLKGGELKKSKLEGYKNQTTDKNLKTSIDLALKFWKLDGNKKNSYSSFRDSLNQDNNFNGSELKQFVEEMCSKDKPKYPKDIPGVNAGTVNTLKKLKENYR
ncbi:MAG: hypothetical protein LBL13_12760 [Bacteroidales bacterium]|jgi:hypothetical protein|nr:hypothetical protein [Bacteroidales bacterium]